MDCLKKLRNKLTKLREDYKNCISPNDIVQKLDHMIEAVQYAVDNFDQWDKDSLEGSICAMINMLRRNLTEYPSIWVDLEKVLIELRESIRYT